MSLRGLRPFLLVVAADGGMGRFVSECLADSFTSHVTSSPEEARSILERDGAGVDMVVSDLFDPPCGCSWVGVVRKNYPVRPLVVMSSAPSAALVRESIRAGASDFLFKPFGAAELVETAERLVGSSTVPEVLRTNSRGLATTLGFKDTDTLAHVGRVARMCVRLGVEYGLGERELAYLEMAALLHDVGKIGVGDEILCKPARLKSSEASIMRRHTLIGMAILQDFNFPEQVVRAVGQHHEFWDGSGYPEGLKGEEIALAARILSVVDSFDAMTSDRIYRPARPLPDALAELRACAGTQFDPEAVRRFLSFVDEEWVQHNTGAEVAFDYTAMTGCATRPSLVAHA